jgi:mannose-1-phosphate guanylyltransferase
MLDVYTVVLAGGSGTRFWPKSRHLRPKQLCALGKDPRRMIELTLDRLTDFVPPERRLIVTHKDQIPLTREIVGSKCPLLIAEPEAKNTANALALAAIEIAHQHKGPGAPVMISLHADHLIRDEDGFRRTLEKAVKVAREGFLTLLGVVPEYPETGYGYIERGNALSTVPGGYRVASFREKPELAVAEEFVRSKKFYWNAGLFVWRVDVIIEELRKSLPNTVTALESLIKAHGSFASCPPEKLAEVYRSLPKISIDHAVLEVSQNVAVVETDIGWQDIGSWSALAKAFGADELGNRLDGEGCMIDTTGTTVDSDGPFVATVGVKDLIVVASGGAILVCPKSRDQDVKKVVEWLQERRMTNLL